MKDIIIKVKTGSRLHKVFASMKSLEVGRYNELLQTSKTKGKIHRKCAVPVSI
jgi:hypothetical protein